MRLYLIRVINRLADLLFFKNLDNSEYFKDSPLLVRLVLG